MAKVLLSADEQRFLVDIDYLRKEISRLETQKVALIQENNKISKSVSDLIEKQIGVEKESRDVVLNAKKEAENIIDLANQTRAAVNLKESALAERISILNEKVKRAEDLIKSNNGLQNNLVIQTERFKKTASELSELTKKIKEIVATL